MVASILYYQNLPDMKTDEAAGKRTLAVILGRRGAFFGLIIFWICIYSSMAVLVFSGILSNLALLGFFTLPLFVLVLYHAKKTQDWVDLDQYGKYVRMLYFLNGLCIIFSLLF
jgi:1,4-dihydroxy-2-naphthoate octaprenyltransferase